MDARQAKGLQIATDSRITRKDSVWTVPSQTGSKKYNVNLDAQTCTCADFEENRRTCKHLFAAEFALQRETGRTLPAPEKVVRPTYRQLWSQYNLSQTREKSYFQSLLYELCTLVEEPIVKRGKGRPPAPLSDLIYAACLKTYGCMSGRRNQTDLDEAFGRGFISRPFVITLSSSILNWR